MEMKQLRKSYSGDHPSKTRILDMHYQTLKFSKDELEEERKNVYEK